MFSAHFVYELPFFRNSDNAGAKAVLGGWQISGIVNATSGPPAARVQTNNDAGRRGNRGIEVSDPLAGQLEFPYWFRPGSYTPAALGEYGTSGRAPFRMPGRHQWDLTASKNFYVSSLRFQFRADFINAFNQTQWTTVDLACTSAAVLTQNTCAVGGTDTFGQITGSRAAREIQLGLKLFW